MPSKWAPLESNPEVLTKWAGQVGLPTEQLGFADVYGLDDELLAMVPQPVYAVLLVFPITKEFDATRKGTDDKIAAEGQPHLDPTIFYIKQTIPNACGTIALLHSIYNSGVTVEPMSALQQFQEQGVGKSPQELATLLENTELFATAHKAAASEGQSSLPHNNDTNDHFVAFVQAPDPLNKGQHRLIELDGRRKAPVDLGESKDLLKDTAKVVKEQYIDALGVTTFAMITLSQNPE